MPTDRIRGQKITQEYFNELVDSTNELFGDTHEGQGPSADTEVQDAIRWGWGGENMPNVERGQKITAEDTNAMVNRINISTLRTNSSDEELVVVARGDKVTADFFNTAAALLEGARAVRNQIDPAYTELVTLGTFTYDQDWSSALEIELEFDFGSYERARHFFNAGGEIRFVTSLSGGYGNGYQLWRCIGWDMGSVKHNVETTASLNNRGTSQDLGFSELTATEQLLYTSPSGSGGGYGGYGGYGGFCGYGGYGGYGGYASSRAKIYGRILGQNLVLRLLIDNTTNGILVRGDFTLTVSMVHPSTITENDVALELPTPICTERTSWREI